MAGSVFKSRLEWHLSVEETRRQWSPQEAEMVAANDAVTISSTKAQLKLVELVNHGRHTAHADSLD